MKAVIQRVKKASVTIENNLYSEIGRGILVLLGVEKGDTEEQAKFLADKIANLRIFEDENEKMNHSLLDLSTQKRFSDLGKSEFIEESVISENRNTNSQHTYYKKGEMLVVSQFTLAGDCKKGKRPSFDNAAKPNLAIPLYEKFIKFVKEKQVPVKTGKFGAMMDVSLINDGPVTFILSK